MELLKTGYTWIQQEDGITIIAKIGSQGKSSVDVQIEADSIIAKVAGENSPRIQGTLFDKVKKNDSYWTVETDQKNENILSINLEKAEPGHWPHVMVVDSVELDHTSEYEIAVSLETNDLAEEALKHYISASEKGSIPAQLKMAAIYAVGKEGSIFQVDVDLKASFKYHLMAAELDSSEGQFFVANAFQFGHGTEINYQLAALYYEKAIMQGNLATQHLHIGIFNLGLLYNTGGYGLELDHEKAIKWWAVGDRVGSTNCIFNLAVMFLNGTGVPQDFNLAVSLFRKLRMLDPHFELPHQINALLQELDKEQETQKKPKPKKVASKTGKKGSMEKEPAKTNTEEPVMGEKPAKKTTPRSPFWDYVGFGLLAAVVVAAFVVGTPRSR